MKVECIYQSKGGERKKLLSLEQLTQLMRGNSLRKRTEALAEAIRVSRVTGVNRRLEAADKLPVANFSPDGETGQHLVLLSFPVGGDASLIQRVTEQAKTIPQTVMTFPGLSGRTLKVVTAFSLPDGDGGTMGDALDKAFLSAASFYGQSLGVSPEGHDHGSPMMCRIGYCPIVWLNERLMSVPLFDASTPANGTRSTVAASAARAFDGYSDLELQLAKFNYIFDQLSFEEKADEDAYLRRLADRCRKAGIEEEVAVRSLLRVDAFKGKDILVRSMFRTAYNDHPLGIGTELSPQIVNQYRLEAFLHRRFQFRRNRVTGVVEYRELDRYLLFWHPLDDAALNSITRQALKEGISVWDKDVRRFVYSNDIADYDPIADYLDQLPCWDGRDRLKEMADRVRTGDELWTDNFKIWMRSMVSQWMGRNRMFGSSMVLMLTGAQGFGKSTFIRLIMPPTLMAYYLDRLDFTTKREAEKAMTHFALINIDEFDQISASQTTYLKHLLQKTGVTHRKMYDEAYLQGRRYAAFAATTNCAQPLTDPTGSRRYLVEEVLEPIDVRTTGEQAIDYGQLYAQVVTEIRQGAPAYFDAERERLIQRHNPCFTVQEPLFDVFSQMFCKPEEGSPSPLRLSAMDILERIHRQHAGISADRAMAVRLGRYLTQNHYKHLKTHERMVYEVAERP